MTTTPKRSSEEGSALVMALVFVFVIGMVILGLLTQTHTSFRVTRVVQSDTDKVYAADAGLEQALEQLRLDRTICPTLGDDDVEDDGTDRLPSITSNGHTVDLACSNEGGGGSSGAEGWAVIITGTATDSFTTQSGGNKTIDGPVYAANLGNPNVAVNNGSVYERASGSSCATDADRPSNLTITPSPPFQFRCTTAGVPDPAHALPGALPAPAPAHTTFDDGDGPCRVFSPGTYTTTPALVAHNYFRSGTYYFHDVLLTVNRTVIGGKRDAAENSVVVSDPCDGAQAADSAPGTGVKWIMGGTSRLDVTNQGHLELFARRDGSGGEGQMGISLQAVTAPGGPFAVNTVPLSTSFVSVGNGSNPELVVHGMVYAPNSYLDTFATNESQANFQGGIVIGKLHLQSSASASGLIVAVSNAPGDRTMLVTATARGHDGTRNVTATAVLELDNNEARTFKVVSWRVE